MTIDLETWGPLHTTLLVERDDPLLALLPQPFGGYPYLIQRIGACPLRHMAVLPANWSSARLLHLVRRQAEANRLKSSLCLGPNEVLQVKLDGTVALSDMIPVGLPVPERLPLAEAIPETEEIAARRTALLAYAKELTKNSGYLVGDGLEGGRPATAGDATRLTVCVACGLAAGEYLADRGQGNGDPAPRIVQVHCACENHNRCAACGTHLAMRRLSSYGYDSAKRDVVYYAAYLAFGHRCG